MPSKKMQQSIRNVNLVLLRVFEENQMNYKDRKGTSLHKKGILVIIINISETDVFSQNLSRKKAKSKCISVFYGVQHLIMQSSSFSNWSEDGHVAVSIITDIGKDLT